MNDIELQFTDCIHTCTENVKKKISMQSNMQKNKINELRVLKTSLNTTSAN